MSTIAKAYVQIIPSTEGITGSITKALGNEPSNAGKTAGEGLGSSLVSTLKGVLAAAGIGALIKETLDAGGALQQSFGGIDTLYAGAEDSMKSFAKEAASAGISANTYAEQAVSFGAALKQSFGGDAKQAAEAANQAILDMADNSAKMGTDIQSVQNAYQGFAKSNYTMLDNLKLGYGGTKEEMQRLLTDAEKLTGIKYDISNFGDITAAIHAIQGDLNIAGVAAQEASTTFTGSFASMSAAAQNLMADLALGEDITADMEMLGTNVSSFLLNNFLPMVGNILSGLPALVDGIFTTLLPQLLTRGMEMITNLSTGVTTSLPELLASANESATQFLGSITEKLPEMLDKGIEMIKNVADGVMQNMPAIISAVGEMINSFVNFILENLPLILEKGVEIIQYVANGIAQNLPAVVNAITNVLSQFLSTIVSHLPQILQKGIEMAGKIASGLIEAIPTVLSACGEIIKNVFSKFKETDWLQIGKDIITGIKNGIVNAAHMIYDAIRDIAERAFETVKDFFDIGSPSKLMADEVGRWLPAGIAVGIEDNLDPLTDAVTELGTVSGIDYQSNLAKQSSYGYGAGMAAGDGSMGQVVALLERYLPNIGSDIYMDGAKVGKVVNKQLGLAL
jgi:phage-related protein